MVPDGEGAITKLYDAIETRLHEKTLTPKSWHKTSASRQVNSRRLSPR